MRIDFIVIIILLPLFLTISQLLLKIGALHNSDRNIFHQYLNPFVISAYILYGSVTILNVQVFSILPLSIANIIVSSTYVLVFISGKIFFKEQISINRVVGMSITVAGILLYSFGS
ncbi:MAG: hypothetical protein OCD02_01330 [Spirochaetaceae bacterium]